MVIVVIHLKDKTASILSILYEGIEYTRLEQNNSKIKKESVIFYIVGMWCNANLFAEKERLHCLFTDIIVTEMSEALLYDINTSQEELD